MSNADTLHTQFMEFLSDPELLCSMYVFFVNHRMYEHTDPLTKTLILMSTAPVQFVLCESGILPFNTSELPVFPFTDLLPTQKSKLIQMLLSIPSASITESSYGNGSISIRAALGHSSSCFMDRGIILNAFIRAVKLFSRLPDEDNCIPNKFCHIIFQRYISSISLPQAISDTVKQQIDIELRAVSTSTFAEVH